jgi:peptidoglycan-associated lipoprotein
MSLLVRARRFCRGDGDLLVEIPGQHFIFTRIVTMKIIRFARLALVATLLAALPGCALFKKKSKYAGVDSGDYVNGTPLPDRQEGVSFTSSNVDKHQFSPVYFAFDSFAIQPSESGKLDQVASALKSGGGTVIIAGFTDERGTPEYNRGLGERRAQAARDHLIGQGVDAGKLQTVSFGAEMPADGGSGEGAWAKNRRAEFGVVK